MDSKDKAWRADAEKKESANLNSPDDTKDELEEQVAGIAPQLPTSLNEELSEKIKDNPNKFIGCGG